MQLGFVLGLQFSSQVLQTDRFVVYKWGKFDKMLWLSKMKPLAVLANVSQWKLKKTLQRKPFQYSRKCPISYNWDSEHYDRSLFHSSTATKKNSDVGITVYLIKF